jgi:TolB-like protein/DNA-binding SARP family transcriptional activator
MGLPLNLIGGFVLRDSHGAELKIALAKGKAIVAFLALAPEGMALRDELIANWWSDRPRTQAHQSIRQTLLALKRDLERGGISAVLRVERHRIGLDLSQLEVDAQGLSNFAQAGACLSTEAALALPVGEFMQGLATRDPVGDLWLQDRRVEFDRHRLNVLRTSLERALSADDMNAAERLARRVLQIDPAADLAHQALICAFIARGERSLAVRQGQLQRGSSPLLRSSHAATGFASTHGSVRQPSAVDEDIERHRLLGNAPKPGLLVMPFARGDAEPTTARLAFGLTDDLVVDLSRLSLASILPPGTSSALGLDQAGSLAAARSLGVDYCLTGSVETQGSGAGARFRLLAMLLDVHAGHMLWAERYERSDRDIWTVRTELSARIASTASQATDMAEMARIQENGTRNRDAWTLRVMAQRNFLRYTRSANARARDLFAKALILDPNFMRAETGLGWTHLEDCCFGWTSRPMVSLAAAEEHAQKALRRDPGFYGALHLLSYVELCRRNYGKAAHICAKARDDNPGDPDLLLHEGYVTSCGGAPKQGIGTIMQSFAINPLHPVWYHLLAGSAALDAERPRTAVTELTRFIDAQQGPIVGVKAQAIRTRSAAHVLLGDMNHAIADRQVYMSANRQFSVEVFKRTFPRQDRGIVQRQADALRAAGFPE